MVTGDQMNAREPDSKSRHLVVLTDEGFQRLNSHGFMKGLLKEGKNLHCIDVDYGPLLRVRTCVAYAPNDSKEVKHVTVGLSLQYSDISFVLSSDGQEFRPSTAPYHEIPSFGTARGLQGQQRAGAIVH